MIGIIIGHLTREASDQIGTALLNLFLLCVAACVVIVLVVTVLIVLFAKAWRALRRKQSYSLNRAENLTLRQGIGRPAEVDVKDLEEEAIVARTASREFGKSKEG